MSENKVRSPFTIHPELVEVWEPKKEYIEKDLWVIRNFLSQEELDWLNAEANDPTGWYDTMRSPYGGNIRNKFLGSVPKYNEQGVLIPPHPNYPSEFVDCPLLRGKYGIEERLAAVLPPTFVGAGALQSFFEVPDDQIIKDLGYDVDYAMNWHYERDDADSEEDQRKIFGDGDKKIIAEEKLTASFNVYINDDFDGGILEFQFKDYTVKPEPGMLVNVPLYKEFMHRVTKVTGGNRHTLYGRCWGTNNAYLSSIEDC